MKCAEHARPGSFPIGSLASRAAARAMFAKRVLDDTIVDIKDHYEYLMNHEDILSKLKGLSSKK